MTSRTIARIIALIITCAVVSAFVMLVGYVALQTGLVVLKLMLSLASVP